MKKAIRKTIILIFWLLVWQVLSFAVHNLFLLVGPLETLRALVRLAAEGVLVPSVLLSCRNILLGFLAGAVLGILFAAGTERWPLFGELITPLMQVIKTVPVVSFIVLVLIWCSDRYVSIAISMLVTLPILFFNTGSGLKSVDTKMKEMAHVYHMPAAERIYHIYLPHLWPFLESGIKTSFGMAFKSGVAAEVIGQAVNTIGNGLYRGKINLATDEILAWTITVTVLSFLLEQILMLILKKLRPGQ